MSKKVLHSRLTPKKDVCETKIEIDFDAIRKRNNHILKSADYHLNEELNFTGEYERIVLNYEDEQLFDPETNHELMNSEKRNVLEGCHKRVRKFRDLAQDCRDDEKNNFDEKRSKTLSLLKDRMSLKYFDNIESSNMDNSSIICSLCQQFIFARDFYKHVGKFFPFPLLSHSNPFVFNALF